ncbi:MAG: DUF3347 domain-containing protein [Chitinophagaceae bacterium]|nr:DUF3347 domain-containing protein [Chitinophagaceae bacterium]
MKKYIITAILFCSTAIPVFAQHDHEAHQQAAASTLHTISNSSLAQLLTSYYTIKDALAGDNADLASKAAASFLKVIHEMDNNTSSAGSIRPLVNDATIIADAKDIKKQRDAFAGLSVKMFALAKSTRLSSNPVYYSYCPMKKAYWLTNSREIKNPYYGSKMSSCGKIVETLN